MSMYRQAIEDYMNKLVNRVYKILPLYEKLEERRGLFKYIQSLLFEFDGLPDFMSDFKNSSEFIVLYATLESLSDEALFDDDNKEVVKREVFKCIRLIEKLKDKMVGDQPWIILMCIKSEFSCRGLMQQKLQKMLL